MKLHIFNPENDLALADGNSNYCPPPMARAIARDLAALPLWYASGCDCVLVSSNAHQEYASCMSQKFTIVMPALQHPCSK
ncbi:MAG: hypothetical protein IKB11_03925 [Bacteroidaceae bacterium]|nr:hypothetical protein [Bacteroidaceae bacterium]